MRQCSKCDQTYVDDDLKFCLADGMPLVNVTGPWEKAAAAAVSSDTGSKQGISSAVIFGVVILAFMIGGGLVMWINKSETPPAAAAREARELTAEQAHLREQRDILRSEQENLEREKLRLAAEKDKPLTETNTRPAVISQPKSGTWLVIPGSYPRHETEKANQRLQYVQDLGYEARIVDTNEYPKLGDGLFSVVLGPYSKSDARSLLLRLRSAVSDAYIKSGW